MSTDEINALQVGDILNNDGLCEIFACSTQGGMRRSHKTNTLVVVSNHIKSIYDDRWEDDVFHYTGMGTEGNQSLDFMQNKTLSNSRENGINVHLFEVFVEKEYSYMGEVYLAKEPYFETQPDELGNSRQACVFPLKTVTGITPIIERAYAERATVAKFKQAKRLSNEEIEKRARNGKGKPGARRTVSQQFERDPWVVEHAKRIASGVCQLCDEPAPFLNNEDEPFLETHHIVWLAKGGEDTIENTVALCPNCHRKMHILNCESDIEFLRRKKSKAADV